MKKTLLSWLIIETTSLDGIITIGASDRARTDTLAFRPRSSAEACSSFSFGGDVPSWDDILLLPSTSLFPTLFAEGDASLASSSTPVPSAACCCAVEDDARHSSNCRVDVLGAPEACRWVCIENWWRQSTCCSVSQREAWKQLKVCMHEMSTLF
jgi:hypothetical protein